MYCHRVCAASSVGSVIAVRTAQRTCGGYKGSPDHCHPSKRTLYHEVLHKVSLCRVSALMSLVGLMSVHCKCSVNNFSTSGVRKSALILNVNGSKRPCRKVKHKRLGVRKVPICESTVNKVNAPADSGRHAGLRTKAARLLAVVGKCDNGRNLRRTTSCVLRLLGRFTTSGSRRLVCFWGRVVGDARLLFLLFVDITT